MKNRILSVLVVVMGGFLLSSCSTNKNAAAKSQAESKVEIKKKKNQAKEDAKVLLNFLYQGKDSEQLQDVTNRSAESIDSDIISKLTEKQDEMFTANGNKDDYYLVIDGSNYYASDIVKDYANAYLKQTKRISFNLKKVKISGNKANITVSYYPIAGLEEANPIGNARTELFGGIDEDTFIRRSQNKDVKTIKSLITLKLYGIYYGDLDYSAKKVNNPVTLEFTLTKKGNSFMANDSVIYQLVKDSRIKSYANNTK